MAGRGSKSTQRTRTEAERARLYAARTAWHERQVRRRIRDNTIIGVVGGLLVVGAIASQFVHAQVSVPQPTATSTPTPTPTETGGTGPLAPTETETPAG